MEQDASGHGLPPNFKAIASRSRKNEFSYLDEVTQKRYMTVDQTWEIYRQREGVADPAKKESRHPNNSQLHQIQLILANPETLKAHSSNWFGKFDINRNGELEQNELEELMSALNASLGIPDVDQPLLMKLLAKFDLRNTGTLNRSEFFQLYKAILRRIRDRFVKARVGKQQFLGKRTGHPEEYYVFEKQLGKGTFGLVVAVTDKRSGHHRVMKVINKTKSQIPQEEIEQEIETLKNFDHPNIIRLYESFEDYQNIYFIMEEAKGGELLKVLAENYEKGFRLNETWLQLVMKQCLQGISYVHANKIIHKDLKCENLMLLTEVGIGNPHVVIIDLGLAEMFAVGGKNAKIGGTPVTMAPEVWRGAFSFKCDIWSLGVVLFQLLSGHLPFMAQSIDPKVWLALHQRGPNWRLLSHCSAEARDLDAMMLRINEQMRPAASDCLNHPWFRLAEESTKNNMGDAHIRALKEYSKRNDLEKAVMLQVASQLSTSSLGKLNDIFQRVDTDHSGTLDRGEFLMAMEELGVDKKSAREAYSALDMDGSGSIEYTEFVAGCLSMFQDQFEEMLWQAFVSLDQNRDGELSTNEVWQLLSKGDKLGLGTSPDEAQIQRMIAVMDTDRSGRISFSEFKRFFLPSQ
eukprot:GEMP01008484.1.p1 GENE.GEMP01008484.1~~GEMP01008484.1.p1  ORF type:complete len:632 (+),score=110.09 GEMP01008484.1:34-1929(+)